MNMNYTAITDQAMPAIETKIFDCLEDRLPAFLAAVNKEQDMQDPLKALNDARVVRQQENEKIGKAIQAICEKELSLILPGAGFWIKGSPRPGGETLWIIDPFSSALMSCASIGIALLHEDKLRMGLLWQLENDIKFYAGVEGEGSAYNGQDIKVAGNKMSAQSKAMNYVMGNRENLRPYGYSIINKFRKKYEYPHLINKLQENMSGSICAVAKGTDDFSYGYGVFEYPAIAAAICIAEQAGAVVTDFSGGSEYLFSGQEYFCSNKFIHAEFMQLAEK